MAIILAIDPGPAISTWVVYDPSRIVDHDPQRPQPVVKIGRGCENNVVRELLYDRPQVQHVVCEDIECFGMAVGSETFQTVRWTGRFEEICFRESLPFDLVARSAVKLHLCGSRTARDPNIRMALLDRFGPGQDKAIGTKATPGPLYGVAGHAWSALALAVTWCGLLAEQAPAS